MTWRFAFFQGCFPGHEIHELFKSLENDAGDENLILAYISQMGVIYKKNSTPCGGHFDRFKRCRIK